MERVEQETLQALHLLHGRLRWVRFHKSCSKVRFIVGGGKPEMKAPQAPKPPRTGLLA
jgi:hypothetical protein